MRQKIDAEKVDHFSKSFMEDTTVTKFFCRDIFLQSRRKERITKEQFFVREVVGVLMSSDISIVINRGIKWYYQWSIDILQCVEFHCTCRAMNTQTDNII